MTVIDLHQVLRLIFALIFVLALMGGLNIVLRRIRDRSAAPGAKKRRLAIVESLSLDPRRRLMLIRRDGTEHLVILGTNGETVIERSIESGQDEVHETAPAVIPVDFSDRRG